MISQTRISAAGRWISYRSPAIFLAAHVLAMFGLVVLSGCGKKGADYASLNLARVTGKITLNREPLVGATVIFEAEEGRYSYGTTDDYGRYTLMYNSEQAGVQAGKKNVRISMIAINESADEVDADASEVDESYGEEGDDERADDERADDERADNVGTATEVRLKIPARYNTATTLQAVVEAGKSQQFNYDLVVP
jgi:hypothetical protein